MSDPTPDTQVSPPSAATSQPAPAPTETVEELKARLAATEKEKEDALTEAKRWKNRVEDENPKKGKEKSLPVSEDDLDWKIANTARVQLVKEAYEKELQELETAGAKLTNTLKTKALEFAESKVLPRNQASSSSPLPSPSIDRGGSALPHLTETDIAFGVKAETKQEYKDYVEGR